MKPHGRHWWAGQRGCRTTSAAPKHLSRTAHAPSARVTSSVESCCEFLDPQATSRQADADARSATAVAGRALDVPIVQFDDLAAHVQTNARTSRVRATVRLLMLEAEELVEDASAEPGRDARARVGHRDHNVVRPHALLRQRSAGSSEGCLRHSACT